MMQIVISDEALRWFKQNMDAEHGDAIKFFARYGGSSPLHEGFSLGVTKEQPDDVYVQIEKEGILFYVEKRDHWFFDGHDLHVLVDSALNELTYTYKKA